MELRELMKEYFDVSPNQGEQFFNLQNSEDLRFDKWKIVESPNRLIKDYMFSSRSTLYEFLRQLFLFEDETNHHATITVENLSARIEVRTHDISAVTEIDTEYAAVAEQIFYDVEQ